MLNFSNSGRFSGKNCPRKLGNHPLPPRNAVRLGFKKNNYQPAPTRKPAMGGGMERRWHVGPCHSNRVHDFQGGRAMNAQRPLPVAVGVVLQALFSLLNFVSPLLPTDYPTI